MSGGGGTLVFAIDEVFDEGVSLGSATEVDFVGAAVSAVVVGNRATVTVGSSSGIETQDEGATQGTGQSILNFVGAGVSVASVGATSTVTITGGGGGGGGSLDDALAVVAAIG